MKRITRNYGIGIVFSLVLATGFFAHLFFLDRIYSKEENRMLETVPTFSMDKLLDGSYQDYVESYASDQFPLRSNWMSLMGKTQKVLGVTEIQGVLIGDDNELFQARKCDKEKGKTLISQINAWQSRHPECSFSFLLAPTKSVIYEDKLPNNAPIPQYDELYQLVDESLASNIDRVDVRERFASHKDEYLFYKTDHHWTSLAAKYAAEQYLQVSDLPFTLEVANEQFFGTLASKCGLYEEADTLHIPFLMNSMEYVVTYEDKTTASVYDPSYQFDKDAYSIFLGGNHPVVTISTKADTDKRILIFKDSYANSFVPYLIPYYSEIVLVDTRYYFDDPSLLLEEKQINEVLFLYNVDTFFNDISFSILKE